VVDSIRATVRTREEIHYSLVFRTAVVALEEVDEPVAAAQIVGLLDEIEQVGAILETLSGGYDEAVERLREVLGSSEFMRLHQVGSRLTIRSGLTLCEAALDTVERRAAAPRR
jgi:hypothetical protein